MDSYLEELRRQRELIQKHLEWLDLKIGEATETEKTPQPQITPEVNTEEVESSEPIIAQPEKVDQPPLTITEPDLDAPIYKQAREDEIMRAKVGCILLFVLGITLFLFLLFGLPNYIYD